jgi:uncharacterized cupin superfamily protein
MRRVNLYNDDYEYDAGDPEEYAGGSLRLNEPLGAQAMVAKAFLLPPATSVSPYHYEYEEEWLIVLDGTVTVRTPEGVEELVRGDTVCFPAGPDGAHKVSNTSDGPARLVMWSSSRVPSVAVYPDSDKIGVWPGADGDKLMVRREDGRRDYWDREP